MHDHAICFIDDDPEELRRFKRALGDRFVIGTGSSPEEALGDLQRQGRRTPDLFLVDLYFPEGPLPSEEELAELHAARAEFLGAQSRFRKALARLGQSSEGGFKIARDLARTHRAGISFFTRKGTLEDAISAYEEAKVVSVIKKPDPDPEAKTLSLREAYDQAMIDKAGLLAGEIAKAIRLSSWLSRNGRPLATYALGVATAILVETALFLATR